MQLSANIFILWSELFKESRRVDRSLAKVKKTFAEVVTDHLPIKLNNCSEADI